MESLLLDVLGHVMARVGLDEPGAPFCQAAAACLRLPDVCAAALLTTCRRRWVEPDGGAAIVASLEEDGPLKEAMRTCARHGKGDVLLLLSRRHPIDTRCVIELCLLASSHGHAAVADALWAEKKGGIGNCALHIPPCDRTGWGIDRLYELACMRCDQIAIDLAAFDGQGDVVRSILARSSRDDISLARAFTDAVLWSGHFDIVRQLVTSDPNVAQTTDLWSLVSLVKRCKGAVKIAHLLLDTILVLDHEVVKSTLLQCAQHGYTRVLRRMLKEFDFTDGEVASALGWAAHNGRAESVRTILSSRPDTDVRRSLDLAAYYGHVDVIDVLLRFPVAMARIELAAQIAGASGRWAVERQLERALACMPG